MLIGNYLTQTTQNRVSGILAITVKFQSMSLQIKKTDHRLYTLMPLAVLDQKHPTEVKSQGGQQHGKNELRVPIMQCLQWCHSGAYIFSPVHFCVVRFSCTSQVKHLLYIKGARGQRSVIFLKLIWFFMSFDHYSTKSC